MPPRTPRYRRETHSLLARETAPATVGLWLAELDAAPPPCVVDAVTDYVTGGHLGYGDAFDLATDSLRRWLADQHDWPTEAHRFTWYSGAVHAVAVTILALTDPGDAVAVLTPSYPPVLRAVGELGRRLVPWPLLDEDDGHRHDLDALDVLLARDTPRLLVLTSPHNPTGRVFTAAEQHAMAARVARHPRVVVLSDEVFADLVHPGHRHLCFARAARAAGGGGLDARTVTVLSASKAFNLAGLRCAAVHAGSAELSGRLAAVPAALTGTTSVVAAIASAAAWDGGHDWLAATRTRLTANRDLLFDHLARYVPALTGRPPEATYLAWLRAHGPLAAPEFPGAQVGADVRSRLLAAGVDLADGAPFGDRTGRRVRLSFGCPPDVLTAALDRLTVTCAAWDAALARGGRSDAGPPG
ncbi:aminotransferase class I/II-fold pyridoxal phosphate-dependent enzyme [Frankia sp. Ag45/Mut15]|uniref:cysteine-S-conjugate beta-lyase n=1 Tax=Frankia umida TaxID=573489 RepID=A0ABT0JUF3_9ACTN|nr:aminotransferase class I/II-fold pyridoxal phosphate-dependent enzyme [Frankia umida]MCK9875180.1 aminotransferase class I/II-fold pyridoxal phosphate-dependent enzyme [Frankia umida]